MTTDYLRAVGDYWQRELGLTKGSERMGTGVHCCVRDEVSGVQLFQRNGLLVICSPPSCADRVAAGVRDRSPEEVFSVDFVAGLLAPEVETILGPACVAYADESTFRPIAADFCRMLRTDEQDLLEAFALALSSEEQEQSGFDPDEAPAFGAFSNGRLCAVASYEMWEPAIAHITVATHPEYRRRGLGRAVISALAAYALPRRLVLQYRALASNSNSIALGRSLGFEPYCSTIYARLREE